MSAPEIRPFAPADAAGAAALLSPLVAPDYPVTAAAVLHLVRAADPGDGAWWVAEAGGEIVGWAQNERHYSARGGGVQRVWAAVRPDHRRRGLGGRLFEAAEKLALSKHPCMLRSWAVADQPDGARFLRAHGYEHRRTDRLWALDPATVDLSDLPRREREAASAGYSLAPLRDGSVVVLAGDEPVALAWLYVDRKRGLAGNAMTGTLREHRHRGLARLAKLATMRWAVGHGIRRIATGNDSTNRDMLALNQHLGYLPLPDFEVFARAP